MSTLLNIAALSRRTGVAPDTLRKWESRYGVLQPERTAGGQRRYSEQDIQRVQWLRDRLSDGWRIGEAARALQETDAPPFSDATDLREALIETCLSDDPLRLSARLDQAIAVLPLERAFEEVIAPMLHAVGTAWHDGRISIAQEHAVTARVRTRLAGLLSDPRAAVRGTAVLACAPSEQHDVGLMMLAVMLRADGWRSEYLGQDTPVRDSVAFAESIGAEVVGFSASREQSRTRLREEIGALDVPTPRPALIVGGPAVTPESARELGALYADDRLSHAVEIIRRFSTT